MTDSGAVAALRLTCMRSLEKGQKEANENSIYTIAFSLVSLEHRTVVNKKENGLRSYAGESGCKRGSHAEKQFGGLLYITCVRSRLSQA